MCYLVSSSCSPWAKVHSAPNLHFEISQLRQISVLNFCWKSFWEATCFLGLTASMSELKEYLGYTHSCSSSHCLRKQNLGYSYWTIAVKIVVSFGHQLLANTGELEPGLQRTELASSVCEHWNRSPCKSYSVHLHQSWGRRRPEAPCCRLNSCLRRYIASHLDRTQTGQCFASFGQIELHFDLIIK